MSDVGDGAAALRPVWRRSVSAGPVDAAEEMTLRCGGPTLTVDERYLLMREKKREMDEAKAREREEAESRESARRPARRVVDRVDDEDDDDQAVKEARNDRYAVKLLRQDTSAWGGGGAESGVLG